MSFSEGSDDFTALCPAVFAFCRQWRGPDRPRARSISLIVIIIYDTILRPEQQAFVSVI